MILQSSCMMSVPRCRPLIRSRRPISICSCSSASPNTTTITNTDHLRLQLDHLHSEAESTRAKVNSARLRLLRLSEAAENLKRQAAISVHSGKESEARELLLQKKKVMQAMERSKSRIELLDQLSAKLNEAISLKESQLIGNVAFDLQVDGKDDDVGPVRVVAPMQGVTDNRNEEKDSSHDTLRSSESQEFQSSADGEAISSSGKKMNSLNKNIYNEDSIIRGLNGISSYEDFLEHLNLQLNRIEAELVTVLNVSAFVLNGKDEPKNSKVQQTIEILEGIRSIRQIITRILDQ